MKKRTVGIALGMTAILCVASVTGALAMANGETTVVSAELSTEETEASESSVSETEAAEAETAEAVVTEAAAEEETEIETETEEDTEPLYLAVAYGEEDAWAQVAITNSEYVDTGVIIRSAADAESEVLGYLYKGTAVWVLDRGETWTEFYSNGITGYVMTAYLLFDADVAEIAEVYGAEGVRAEWNDVNIYTSDDAATVIDTMDAGEVYQVVNDYGHWIEILYDEDTTAFVSSEDVTSVMLFESATPKDGERVELVDIYAEFFGEATETDTYTETEAAASTSQSSDSSSSTGSSSTGSSSSGSSSSSSSSTGSSSSGSPSTGSSSSSSSSTGSSSSGSSSSGSSSSSSSSAGSSSSSSSSSSSTTQTEQTETTATEQTETTATEATQTETSSSSSSSSSDDDGYYDADTDTYYDGDGNVVSTASYEADTTETAAAASAETVYTEAETTAWTEAETVYTEAETTAWTETETVYTEAETAASTEAETAAASASVSTDDTTLLAALIYCEAGNQSYDGMVAVGAVVMNRVNSSSFPNTISEVIYQSGQFSPASSGALATALANGVPSTCYTAAAAAIAGEDPTGGALYFNTTANKGIQIGDHWFY
ncbi:MAG: cell wall hydrolase [Lachnospiraceae bacterium]|nr:cell wall hydrolase [Lachnospiraceae bacterium]